MAPPPKAVGLTLCDRVILEQGTKDPTLIGIFLNKKVGEFPTGPLPFTVFSELVGGRGTGAIEVIAVRLATREQIYSQRGAVTFPDRPGIIHVQFRVTKLCFPEACAYDFMLFIEGDLIAQRRLVVYQYESQK